MDDNDFVRSVMMILPRPGNSTGDQLREIFEQHAAKVREDIIVKIGVFWGNCKTPEDIAAVIRLPSKEDKTAWVSIIDKVKNKND